MAVLDYDQLIEALSQEGFGQVDAPPEKRCEPSMTGGHSETDEKSDSPIPTGSPSADMPAPETLGVARGYLTLHDMPELQGRLENAGWKVTRRGNELVCHAARKLRPQ